MNELDEILENQKKQGLNSPNEYKAHLYGCTNKQLEIEREYLETQLFRCVPSDEKYFQAKLDIVRNIETAKRETI